MQRTHVCLQLKGSPNRSFRHHLSSSRWESESQKPERGRQSYSFGSKMMTMMMIPFYGAVVVVAALLCQWSYWTFGWRTFLALYHMI
jgi:hypothetical protein